MRKNTRHKWFSTHNPGWLEFYKSLSNLYQVFRLYGSLDLGNRILYLHSNKDLVGHTTPNPLSRETPTRLQYYWRRTAQTCPSWSCGNAQWVLPFHRVPCVIVSCDTCFCLVCWSVRATSRVQMHLDCI